MITKDISYQSGNDLILGDGVQSDSVVPTATTAYQRGDLLVIGADNVATHSVDGNDWHVVCAENVTAQQVDTALEQKLEIPVYTQGEINVNAVKINGTLLTDAQKTTARGRANSATSIELRTPFGKD